MAQAQAEMQPNPQEERIRKLKDELKVLSLRQFGNALCVEYKEPSEAARRNKGAIAGLLVSWAEHAEGHGNISRFVFYVFSVYKGVETFNVRGTRLSAVAPTDWDSGLKLIRSAITTKIVRLMTEAVTVLSKICAPN